MLGSCMYIPGRILGLKTTKSKCIVNGSLRRQGDDRFSMVSWCGVTSLLRVSPDAKRPGEGPRVVVSFVSMRPNQWRESYRTHIGNVDAQHVGLFDTAAKLADAIASGEGEHVVRSVLFTLLEYTRTHFAEEELLMKQVNYPAIEAHLLETRLLHRHDTQMDGCSCTT